MRFRESNITRDTSKPGLYKVIPNFNWETMFKNAEYHMVGNVERNIDIVDEYLKGHRDFLNDAVQQRSDIYVSYVYLSSTEITPIVLDELNELVADMTRNKGTRRDGNDLIASTRNWNVICRTITHRDALTKSFLWPFQNNDRRILWINTELLEPIMKFFTVASSDVKKYDDKTYEFTCHTTNGKVLLLSNPDNISTKACYTPELLDKYFYKFFLGTEDGYFPNFTTEQSPERLNNRGKLLERMFRNVAIQDKLRTILDCDAKISNAFSTYMKYINEKQTAINGLGVASKLLADTRGLLNVLEKMKDTITWDINEDFYGNGEEIILTITSPLFNYDEDLIKRMYRNGSMEAHVSKTNWAYKFLKDCFVENKFEIMTKTSILLNIRNWTINNNSNAVRAITNGGYGDEQMIGYFRNENNIHIPNPHIARFNCFGQNGPVIINLFKDRKWEELLYCIKATVGNINFSDTTVFRLLVRWIQNCPDRVVIARNIETNEFVTIENIKELYPDEEN